MMSVREILFRGKRISDNSWVYGGIYPTFHPNFPQGSEEIVLSERNNNCYAICANGKDVYVYQETIGQYTGLTDKNGKKIFEGDIIRCKLLGIYCAPIISKVTTKIGAYGMEWQLGNDTKFTAFYNANMLNYEVIGNIHDNPELLEVE